MKNRNVVAGDEWYTPPELYKEWDQEFQFDFDPCPANRADGWDGLEMDWGTMNYVNPPYSRKLNLVEYQTSNLKVVGSIPSQGYFILCNAYISCCI